ncbi:MAG: hypothetical protein A2508_04105 [Candidatus Lambdaproteobacteria bacterium RIFOXYD12_FULL_49_8]|nr:MAG: hypothetical protein A2508_04105 [Candidatus Lambdaproteobacteria bacterium RIFOXYD12_FULL_49_8]
MSLYSQIAGSIRLGAAKKEELTRSVEKGGAFFEDFNESRLKLAFSNFSDDMKKALYEILFFLHVNNPRFKQHTYTTLEITKVEGTKKEVPVTKEVNLYLEGAPCGVEGIHQLSGQFKDDFQAFIQAELKSDVPAPEGFQPIYSVASLGSIGTIGHKITSDLDLQVQFELSPFLYREQDLTDEHLLKFGTGLIHYFGRVYAAKKKYTQKHLGDPKIKNEIVAAGKQDFKRRFPILYHALLIKKGEQFQVKQDKKIDLIHEIVAMVNLHRKYCLKAERQKNDGLLKKRIKGIQDYIQSKYPKAEIYLFAYSNDDYRDGKHGTTLESKEASGSAYELILNYEVLMPGIQFTPMVPIHFLMPPEVNANRNQYERLVNYLRYHFIDLYDPFGVRLVDLGSTPPLTQSYMVAHAGAIYWESFKASSGNLPKALLNLLRIEMLFDSRFDTSMIELIKDPHKLDTFVTGEEKMPGSGTLDTDENEKEEEFFNDYGVSYGEETSEEEDEILGEADFAAGLSVQEIFRMEDLYPLLTEDPWWLRYKALKIGFSEANRTVESAEERAAISATIDLGFALHIRISDVFAPPEKGKEMSHRDKVLRHFLEKAFPLSKRVRIEHIFMGEVQAVNLFEEELRSLFKGSMNRVNRMVEQSAETDKTNRDEYSIWYHYYQTNFDPKPNVVRLDILTHLKVARGRLQIGYDQNRKLWFFKSLQKGAAGDAKQNFSDEALEHLPDEVVLLEHPSFLHGIAHCIMNGYYGVFKKGTLYESHTQVEFSVAHMNLGKRSANEYAYLTPDLAVRMIEQIKEHFVPQTYDYRDCINKKREVTDIFICLSLLEFGSLSILYRDNMKVWYMDFFEHPELEEQADQLYEAWEVLLGHPVLAETIKGFFAAQNFRLTDLNKDRVAFWVNLNCARSGHGGIKQAKKEQDLAKHFKKEMVQQTKARRKKVED